MKVSISATTGDRAGTHWDVEEPDLIIIGRAPDCRVRSRDRAMAPYHALLEIVPPSITVRALGGAYIAVNGGAVIDGALHEGDRLTVGETTYTVALHGAAETRSSPLAGVPGLAPLPVGAPGRCGRCGDPVRGEATPGRAHVVPHLCTSCRDELLTDPIVPPDHVVRRRVWLGADSAIFEAEHVPSGQSRALEILVPTATISMEAGKRLMSALARSTVADEPHLVRLRDAYALRPGIFALSRDWSEQVDAANSRAPGQLVELEEFGVIARAALDALAHSHAHGRVHRDLREADIHIERRGDAIDVRLNGVETAAALQLAGLRRAFAGPDVSHVAPEVLLDFRTVQPASDIYAMGAALYQMLAGVSPLQLSDGRDPLAAILEARIVPVESRRPEIPPELGAVIERALYHDATRRFRSAAAMRAALEAALA